MWIRHVLVLFYFNKIIIILCWTKQHPTVFGHRELELKYFAWYSCMDRGMWHLRVMKFNDGTCCNIYIVYFQCLMNVSLIMWSLFSIRCHPRFELYSMASIVNWCVQLGCPTLIYQHSTLFECHYHNTTKCNNYFSSVIFVWMNTKL